MLNDAVGIKRIFLKVGYTDLRKGIPGLTAMCNYNENELKRNLV